MSAPPEVSLAIVSHRQLPLVARALDSLASHPPRVSFEIVLVENDASRAAPAEAIAGFPVRAFVAPFPVGLARNLNWLFPRTRADLFCIVNPDVVFLEDVITPLADIVRRGETDIAAPTIVDSRGRVLASARRVPRPLELVARRLPSGSADAWSAVDDPTWLAGTFLMMRRDTFEHLGGFDERYYLYFEDVDFGCRARLAGLRLTRHPGLRLSHDPARRSRSHPRYLAWHVASAVRFFLSPTYRAARAWEGQRAGPTA